MLTCPDCHRGLLARKVHTHSGGKIEIDKCPFCAGIWFDHFEANQVPFSEIKRLVKEKPKTVPSGAIGQGKCPHCLVPLIPLDSESVPKYLNVFTCPQCRGNWFSQKNLLEFKVAQKAKVNYFKLWRLPLPSVFSALLPIFLLTVLALSIPVTLIGLKEKGRRKEIRIKASEVIIKPTTIVLNPTTVILTWATTTPVISEIKYWTKAMTPKTLIVSPSPSANHTIELKNLLPSTLYFYQLILKDYQGRQIHSELYSFITK